MQTGSIQAEEAEAITRDELPVDGKQETERRRENLEVSTAQMGDASAVPTL